VLGYGLPVGLGSHVHWDRKLDGLLAQALMSIQAVKGVEMGDGFDVAGRRGSEAHDPIFWDAQAREYRRDTTRAGGLEGGMTTGELLVARVAMKPLATLNRPTLTTVDTATNTETVSFKERTDVTAVPAMGVVAETMTALVLADEVLRKFGGDSMSELIRNHDAFLDQVRRSAEAVSMPLPSRIATRAEPQTDDAPLNWDEIEAFADLDEAAAARAVHVEHHIVLVGMMGAGKTSVGRQLAESLDVPFVDSDEQVEARTGRTVRDIFEHSGEAAFRFEEKEALASALDSRTPSVIAAAGGTVTDADTRSRLRDLLAEGGHVIWLRATPQLLATRVTSGNHRPLLEDDPEGTLQRLNDERQDLYRSVADIVLDEHRGGHLLDVDALVTAARARLADRSH
jgi:shikimate kinase